MKIGKKAPGRPKPSFLQITNRKKYTERSEGLFSDYPVAARPADDPATRPKTLPDISPVPPG